MVEWLEKLESELSRNGITWGRKYPEEILLIIIIIILSINNLFSKGKESKLPGNY